MPIMGPNGAIACESAPKWDPGTFGHTGLIIHTKSGEGWGPDRRRSGPHSMLKLRATSIRYLELERGPSSVLIHNIRWLDPYRLRSKPRGWNNLARDKPTEA
jgi:hypothetical protein